MAKKTKNNSAQTRYNIFQDTSAYPARDSHLSSLKAFVKNNPEINGINTEDYLQFMSELAGLEGTYNKAAKNPSGYSGYYGIKGGDALSEDKQHKAAFEHMSHLFKHIITDDDIRAGKEKGYTPAQILYKYWNQENQATEFLQNGDTATIGNNIPIEDAGWNMTSDIDYEDLVQTAITDPYYVVRPGDSFDAIQRRARYDGRSYNQKGDDLIQYNTHKGGVFVEDKKHAGKYKLRPLQVGDTIWFSKPPVKNAGGTLYIPGIVDGFGLEAQKTLLQGYSGGGGIHIKPENRGKFTALKKRTGHSATWFKEHGTPAQKKMATFALNARKWHHGDGGPLDRALTDGRKEQILQAIKTIKAGR